MDYQKTLAEIAAAEQDAIDAQERYHALVRGGRRAALEAAGLPELRLRLLAAAEVVDEYEQHGQGAFYLQASLAGVLKNVADSIERNLTECGALAPEVSE
jgi:hypothetical protein